MDSGTQQEIRFCRAADGVTLAWARSGRGPALVKAANWLSHLEYDWHSPVWRPLLERLGRHNTVIRYDERGCGLSDRDVDELGFDSWVRDLEAVVDAAGRDRFPRAVGRTDRAFGGVVSAAAFFARQAAEAGGGER
jgi:pimeloyl-ACP methyl ester carboxylesterase